MLVPIKDLKKKIQELQEQALQLEQELKERNLNVDERNSIMKKKREIKVIIERASDKIANLRDDLINETTGE